MLQDKNNILFGKYQIISKLGTGNFGTVYLSKHLILECYRAIKIIPKTNSRSDSLLKEAQVLKSLQHPGIPCLYDIEEDEIAYYLIEEYVEGESLEQFLLHQKHISLNTFLDFSLQLCNIFQYLHTIKPSPILYLDLKPEHIIVCGMQIKLIDFNVATFISNLGNMSSLFGNEEFSAPELSFGVPSLQSDIFAIGKILEYLSNFLDVSLYPSIYKILKTATAAEPRNRFETVNDFAAAMEQEKIFIQQPHSRKRIAIIGSHCGCGSTHVAISLVSTLNYMGYRSSYYEKNSRSSLQNLRPFLSYMREKNGMICYRFFQGYPLYGQGVVTCLEENEDFSVYDYGNSHPPFEENFDVLLLVCSNAVWNWHEAFQKGELLSNHNSNLTILCNMGQKNTMYCFSKQFKQEVYHFPHDTDAFIVTSAKVTLFSKLLHIKRRKTLFFHLRNRFIQRK